MRGTHLKILRQFTQSDLGRAIADGAKLLSVYAVPDNLVGNGIIHGTWKSVELFHEYVGLLKRASLRRVGNPVACVEFQM